MISFNCDYMEGAHPAILERLAQINFDKNTGYGLDEYCDHARQLIRQTCCCPTADVQFLVGGTQTNSIVIDAMLRHNEGVIAPHSGHINVHEAGAIEACGHKVIARPAVLGKYNLDDLERYLLLTTAELNAIGWEHYVVPKAVYLSFPTEYGTLYNMAELSRLREICDKYDLYMFIDGARLGYGLASPSNDVTLPDIARLADVFYIGGTKVGALFGEAVVVTNPEIKVTRGLIKSHGALLAKGWLLGLQFATLMDNNLYLSISHNAVAHALHIRQEMAKRGYDIYIDSPTNQQFFVMPNDKLEQLSKTVGLDVIETLDETHTVVRICTSWATTAEQVEQLLAAL